MREIMTNSTLQYYLHDEPDAFRLELSGSLSADGARSVYQAWRTALSTIGLRRVIVDITYVSEIDERGRALLRLLRRRQARIVAASPQSRALAEAVLEEPFPEPPVQVSALQRASAFVRRLAARAGFPATAEARPAVSAPGVRQDADFPAPGSRGRLESRVPS